jgi:hypothetical protein
MSEAVNLLRAVARRADEAALSRLYDAVSVSTDATRARLDRVNLVYAMPGQTAPRTEELDRTADWLIGQSTANATALGGLAGLAGWLSVPPEVAAYMVATLRLGQRLAVTYGLDPETERGRLALARALAAGFEVPMPARGVVGMRASDLARAFLQREPDTERVGGQLARAVALRTTRMMGGRLGRLVPVVSSGFSAVDNRRQTHEIGRRMKDVLRRLADMSLPSAALIEDAHEVG